MNDRPAGSPPTYATPAVDDASYSLQTRMTPPWVSPGGTHPMELGVPQVPLAANPRYLSSTPSCGLLGYFDQSEGGLFLRSLVGGILGLAEVLGRASAKIRSSDGAKTSDD